MADNGRIYKDAYRTCKREYDTLMKKHESDGGASVSSSIRWMLPVLACAAAAYALLYFAVPGKRMVLTPLFICIEAGLALAFAAYLICLALRKASSRGRFRTDRLRSILEQLDEAWAANDPNESAMRAINAERELRKTRRFSAVGVRDMVMNGTAAEEPGRGEKTDER